MLSYIKSQLLKGCHAFLKIQNIHICEINLTSFVTRMEVGLIFFHVEVCNSIHIHSQVVEMCSQLCFFIIVV